MHRHQRSAVTAFLVVWAGPSLAAIADTSLVAADPCLGIVGLVFSTKPTENNLTSSSSLEAAEALPAGKDLWCRCQCSKDKALRRPFGINYLLFPGRCWAFRLASAHGAAARAKTTAAWTFTDVAGGAETSTRHNCLRSGSQLMDRYSARRKSGREHRCEQEFSGHLTCSFGNAVFKDSVANPEVNRNAGAGFPGRFCTKKFETKAILELPLSCCYTH
jgi:hypothetical protein